MNVESKRGALSGSMALAATKTSVVAWFLAIVLLAPLEVLAACSEAMIGRLLDKEFSRAEILSLCSAGKASAGEPPSTTPVSGTAAAAAKAPTAAEIEKKQTAKENADAAAKEAKELSDQGSLKGDYLKFKAVTGPVFVGVPDNTKSFSACVNTRVKVRDERDEDGKRVYYVRGVEKPDECKLDSGSTASVETGHMYKIAHDDLRDYDYTRKGWRFGTLVVPFKYQFEDHSITGAGTIGAYVGYRKFFDSISSITPIVSLGLTKISFQDQSSGTQTNVTTEGLSYGAGLIWDINKGTGFTAGLIVGADRVKGSGGAKYLYDRKPWLSLMLGYQFLE